jgi:hypothetical protein
MKLRLLLMTDQIAAKAKLAYRVANMAGSGLQSAQTKRLKHECKQTAIHRQGGSHDKC